MSYTQIRLKNKTYYYQYNFDPKLNFFKVIQNNSYLDLFGPIEDQNDELVQFFEKKVFHIFSLLISKKKIIIFNKPLFENKHFYASIFGEGYKIEALFGSFKKPSFLILPNLKKINLFFNERDKNNIKKLEDYYFTILGKILLAYITETQRIMENNMNYEKLPIRIDKSTSAWGKYRKKIFSEPYISYSIALLGLDKELINSVILHELGHHKHQNHSKEFKNYCASFDSNFTVLQKEIKNYWVIFKKWLE
ncbi:YgjP-like metallopeptidase domain-containing protein [Mycoplasmopsis opalescens]|uniref:YgjP-like metallopeptidase domain-containing protein n=1 Tax=Mycoplasmopsis opalescens TaxID=114886 RepID=UPI0004A736D9|nr:YgjP-like metallopeptidase domain-containing protein [Mycoplasmopsis opalescens]